MRLALAIAALALAAAMPLRAQQADSAVGDAAHPERAAGEAGLAAEWTKLEDHWKMVESLPAGARAEHREMHRAMLAGFMDELVEHAAKEAPPVASEEDVAGMRDEHENLRGHWRMIEGIRDREQLQTHLAMHMQMLESLHSEGAKAGVHPPAGAGVAEHERMRHEEEGMDHGGMHGEAEQGEPAAGAEPRKPAGY